MEHKKTIISLDIETTCGVEGCPGYKDQGKCPHNHALHFKKNDITVVGAYWKDEKGNAKKEVITSLNDLNTFIRQFNGMVGFIGHNFKFDIKSLIHKSVDITISDWIGDTHVMAVALSEKIPQEWLNNYSQVRQAVNKKLGRVIHRDAGQYSLKTLAPYFANVEPFWEVIDKSDANYVLKDVEYTYKLYEALKEKLILDDTYNFYINKLLPWTQFLARVEMQGIKLDMNRINSMETELNNQVIKLKRDLDGKWSKGHKAYYKIRKYELEDKYKGMYKKAKEKLKESSEERISKLQSRYQDLYVKASEKVKKKINFDSPSQLTWLLKNYLKYNITDNDGKESTGKEVLERLALEGNEDIKLFIDYRKAQKLLTSFFPTYKEMCDDNHILNCNFNIGGTRTGRLSSSEPNLQQVPRNMHDIFIAREGYKLATYDMSAIEPHIIAYLSEDPVLCKILMTDGDFHGDACQQFFENITLDTKLIKKEYPKERDLAKQADLSIFYGSGKNMLQKTALKHGFDWSIKECKEKIDRFRKRFQGVTEFKNNLDKLLETKSIFNVLGRKLKIIDKNDIYMKGFNSLIQGSASDLVLNSAYEIQNEFDRLGIDANVLLLVHDEIVCEIPLDKEEICVNIIKEKMTRYKLFTKIGEIHLKVEGVVSKTWEK